MKKKLSQMLTVVCSWGVLLLTCGFMITTMTACGNSDNDEPAGNGVDDLAYLQKRIANDGSLVYGVVLGTDTKDIVSRPVASIAGAQAEFYKLIPGGPAHQGLNTANDGTITCHLTDKNGTSQGTITYLPSKSEKVYYYAEVSFGAVAKSTTGISSLRYILYNRWPEEGNGLLKDIMDMIKE